MKYIEGFANGSEPCTIELTRRNLGILLAKLDDPLSHATLLSPCGKIIVRAVDDDRHYSDREPGEMFMPTAGVTI